MTNICVTNDNISRYCHNMTTIGVAIADVRYCHNMDNIGMMINDTRRLFMCLLFVVC